MSALQVTSTAHVSLDGSHSALSQQHNSELQRLIWGQQLGQLQYHHTDELK